jgi:hypothetical protein
VERDFVFFRERDGDSALRVLGVRFVRAIFGEDRDAGARAGQFDGSA